MNFKKRVNGSWTDTPHYIHNTSTDTFTTLPADIYADGNNATVGLKGNTVQNGTPTPTTPIQPSECGERTGNLAYGRIDGVNIDANGTIGILSGFDIAIGRVESGVTYTANTYVFAFYTNEPTIGSVSYDGSRIVTTSGEPSTFTAPITGYVAFRLDPGEPAMLNLGSEALPYEPYGVKIPISSANTTTPVYLGEVETTRKIKKLVFDGTENWDKGTYAFYSVITGIATYKPVLCSHYQYYEGASSSAPIDSISTGNDGGSAIWIKTQNHGDTTVEQWKSYLAQQYAAGTPVTVWYVLAEPTTGIVNEPLMKIGEYADTVSGISIPTMAGADSFDVLTTLKPSEVTVNYKGWHPVADVHERENGAWD